MTQAARPAEPPAVAVFAKAPVPGEVKTRLAPMLGEEAAAELHAVLVRRALATACGSGLGPVSLWCAPDPGHPFFAACAQEFGVTLHGQRGSDLGERMAHAFDVLLARSPALLIGTDCPVLNADDLRTAAASLSTHDAVFQPAEDGGYVLVGLACPVAAVFDGIAWGEGRVMLETRARLRVAGARWRELPMRWDVDRPEDYRRLVETGVLAGASR